MRLGGAAIGAHLYAVHVLVNAISDASARGLYDATTSRMLLAEQDALLRTLSVVAAELAEQTGLPAADKRFVAKANGAAGAVLELISAARRIVQEPTSDKAREDFAELRASSLAKVRGVLGTPR